MSVGIIAGNCFSISIIAQTLTPAEVATITTAEQTFTVPGLKLGDAVFVNPPGLTAGVTQGGVRVSAADTLAIQYVNPSAAGKTPPAGVHTITVIRYDGSPAERVLS